MKLCIHAQEVCIVQRFSVFRNTLIDYVFSVIVFSFIVTGLSALFPEEQKKYNISKDVIRNNVVTNVTKARDYLRQVNSTKLDDNFDIKFSVIIEKPTEDDHLPMSVLVSEMGRCHQPPIICDVYQVIRHNAVVKDSNWVKWNH